MDRIEVDAMLKHQREVIATSRITVEPSLELLARTNERISNTRSVVTRRRPPLGGSTR